jgi:D-alanyl-D-alanine dipeptidase
MFRLHFSKFLYFALILTCCPHATAQVQRSTQLLVVTTSDWDAVHGQLQRYERENARDRWKAVGQSVNVVVGKSGLGWGSGIRPAPKASGPIKKEGDGKAPAGMFRLSATFGYASTQPSAWKMPYIAVTKTVECVDDPSSKFYNRIVDRGTVSPDWNSAEHMLLADERYQWGIVVDHNAANKARAATPGAGSCIFLHIWLRPENTTVGCTAMSQTDLETVLAWLDPSRRPILVQLPEPQYKSLQKPWKLPGNF